MDGTQVMRMLREGGLNGIPVVALTARPPNHSSVTAERGGFARCLEKPVSPLYVLQTVEAVIGRAPAPGVGSPPQFREIAPPSAC